MKTFISNRHFLRDSVNMKLDGNQSLNQFSIGIENKSLDFRKQYVLRQCCFVLKSQILTCKLDFKTKRQ